MNSQDQNSLFQSKAVKVVDTSKPLAEVTASKASAFMKPDKIAISETDLLANPLVSTSDITEALKLSFPSSFPSEALLALEDNKDAYLLFALEFLKTQLMDQSIKWYTLPDPSNAQAVSSVLLSPHFAQSLLKASAKKSSKSKKNKAQKDVPITEEPNIPPIPPSQRKLAPIFLPRSLSTPRSDSIAAPRFTSLTTDDVLCDVDDPEDNVPAVQRPIQEDFTIPKRSKFANGLPPPGFLPLNQSSTQQYTSASPPPMVSLNVRSYYHSQLLSLISIISCMIIL